MFTGYNCDFGLTSTDYATHRAGFPDIFMRRIGESAGLAPGLRLLDLGTGTGTLARGFARLGARVTGLDLSPQMLCEAARLTREEGLEIEFLAGDAAAIALPDESFDLVTAGQCWHWFDAAATGRELRRVLRPGGRVVIGHFDWLPLPGNVVQATEDLIRAFSPDWPMGGRSGLYPRWLSDLAVAGFIGIESHSFDLDQPYRAEDWRGRVRASAGVGGSLDAETVARFDAALAEILARDFPGERLAVPHRCWWVEAVNP